MSDFRGPAFSLWQGTVETSLPHLELDMVRASLGFMILLLLALVTSSGVHAEEQKSAAATSVSTTASPVSIPNLSGTWSGEWSSQSTGHRGPMTAHFTRRCDNWYDVTFKGRFCRLIPFRYSTVLRAVAAEDGSVTLSGQKNLGLLLGTFRFTGNATACQLNARYCSKDDTGHFRLTRSTR